MTLATRGGGGGVVTIVTVGLSEGTRRPLRLLGRSEMPVSI